MALHKSSRLLSVGELAPLAAGAFSSWSFCRSRSHRPLFDRHSISVLAVHLDPMDGVAEDVLAGDARVARHVISCRSLKKDVVTSSVLIRLLVQLVDRLLDELIAATKVKAAALDVALKGLFLRQFSPCLLRNPLLDLCGVFREEDCEVIFGRQEEAITQLVYKVAEGLMFGPLRLCLGGTLNRRNQGL